MTRTKEELDRLTAESEQWLDELDLSDPDAHVESNLHDLRAIARARRDVEVAEDRLRVAVQNARAHGRSWTRIAMMLDVSRQAARQRFGSSQSITTP